MYGELLALLDNLPTLVRATRHRRRQSLADVESAAGVSRSALSRLENGEAFHVHTLRAVLRWLDGEKR